MLAGYHRDAFFVGHDQVSGVHHDATAADGHVYLTRALFGRREDTDGPAVYGQAQITQFAHVPPAAVYDDSGQAARIGDDEGSRAGTAAAGVAPPVDHQDITRLNQAEGTVYGQVVSGRRLDR